MMLSPTFWGKKKYDRNYWILEWFVFGPFMVLILFLTLTWIFVGYCQHCHRMVTFSSSPCVLRLTSLQARPFTSHPSQWDAGPSNFTRSGNLQWHSWKLLPLRKDLQTCSCYTNRNVFSQRCNWTVYWSCTNSILGETVGSSTHLISPDTT